MLNSGACHNNQSSFSVYRALQDITSTGPLIILWFKVVTSKKNGSPTVSYERKWSTIIVFCCISLQLFNECGVKKNGTGSTKYAPVVVQICFEKYAFSIHTKPWNQAISLYLYLAYESWKAVTNMICN